MYMTRPVRSDLPPLWGLWMPPSLGLVLENGADDGSGSELRTEGKAKYFHNQLGSEKEQG